MKDGTGMDFVFGTTIVTADITIYVQWELDTGEPTTFTHSVMRPWFDHLCAPCHGVGNSNARNWTYNPNDYNASFKNNIDRIKRVTLSDKTMPPPQNPRLSQGEIDKLTDWFNRGAPAK